MIAKIAVAAANFAIDKPYSYAIPEGLDLQPGMRVMIPFGRSNRRTNGIVLTVEEGQTAVVVLKIQRLTKPRGQLIDKAKDTAIFARMLFVHQGRFKFEADVVVLLLVDHHLVALLAAIKAKTHGTLSQIKTVIQNIADLAEIDGMQSVTRQDTCFFGARMRRHRRNRYHMRPSFWSFGAPL